MIDNTGLHNFIPITPMENFAFHQNTMLLHGEPKIGKTTWASHLPNCIFLDGEKGTIGINVPTWENLLGRDRFRDPISTWPEVLQGLSMLEQAKAKIPNLEATVVIDTGPAIYQWCRTWVQAQPGQGWEHESDVKYGKAWNAVSSEFSQFVNRIKGLGFGICFISHTDEKEIKEPTRKYEKKVPRLGAGARNIIEPFVNLILYAENMHINGRDFRVLHTKGSTAISAGERGEVTRLQTLLPFDYDAVNRNWEGEVIDLNVWFGLTPPPTNTAVGAATPDNATPPVNNPDPGVAAVAREFDATLTN